MGRTNKGKTQRKRQDHSEERGKNTRNWIELFVAFVIISLIFVNSMYLDGYYCGEASYDSGSLVLSSYGYQADGSNFSYSDQEGAYIQIAGGEDVEQLLFSFQNAVDKDVNVDIYCVDSEGNVSDAAFTGLWKKGRSYMKAKIDAGSYNSFLVSIPSDFSLSKVYYAVSNDISSGRKIVLAIIFIIFSAIITTILMYFKTVRKVVANAEKKITTFGCQIWNDRKRLALYLLIYGVVVGVGSLVTYLLAKQGRIRISDHLMLLVFLIGMLFLLMIVEYREFTKRLEWIAMLVILVSGGIFAFTEPANVGISWDDEIHFSNAVQLSHMFDKNLSVSDHQIINDYVGVALERKNYSQEEQKRYNELLDVLEKSDYYVEMSDYAINNTTIAYIPSAMGMAVGRGLGLPFHVVIALGRWMNTWLLAILAYFAMKQLKTGKMVVFLISMIPTNIFLAGSYNYDIWLTAWSMLGLAAFFGEWQKPSEKISTGQQWLIAISLYLAVCPKQVYFPLTCIALFMPMSKFSSKRNCWLYRCLILAACLFPVLAVYIQNFSGEGIGQGDIRGGETVDATAQIAFIRNNPSKAGKILFDYLKGYLNPYKQGAEYTTKLAYMGYIPIDFRYILGILLAGAVVSREEKEPVKFPWWSKAGVLFVYIIIGTIAALSMYIAFTPVGLETVNGCQGRYLIPALFPVLYLWSRFSCKTWIKNLVKETNINILLIVALLFICALGVWNCCIIYY